MTAEQAAAAVQSVLEMGHDNDCPALFWRSEPCWCGHEELERILAPVLEHLSHPPGRSVYVIAAETKFDDGGVNGAQTLTVQTPVPLAIGDVLVLYTFAEAMPEWLAYLKT